MTWRLDVAGLSRPSLIVGGRGALETLGEHAGRLSDAARRAFVVTDENVWAAQGEPVSALLGAAMPAPPRVLPPGERSKSVGAAEGCWQWLAGLGARRDDVVVAVGGGVVGDLAGFVAATYLRGVGLWQVPTSLLAQVDSSVGGKVAVDLPAGKNLVGAFYQPELVVVEPATLASLPADEFRAGLGEVVKYGLLDQRDLFSYLEGHVGSVVSRRPEVLDDVVRRCVAYKVEVVRSDEDDRGRRAVLNLGHTAAHALESGLGYGAISHGAAVGLGLLVALTLSERLVDLSPEVRARTRALLQALGLPVRIALPTADRLLEAAGRDKKITAAGAGFVCLRAIGEPMWGVPVEPDTFLQALEEVRE